MEIKGENFIKNIQIQQEKEELLSQLNELDKNIEPSTSSTYEYNSNQEDSELDDIMLENNGKTSSNKSNKKKYIALGLALTILFLLTIVAFRLLTNKSTQDSTFVETESIKQDKVLSDDNIEKQYQKIINEKLKTINNQKTELENKQSSKSMNLKEIEKEEKKVQISTDVKAVQKAKELKEDIFEIKNGKKVEQPKKVTVKTTSVKIEPKKEIDKILAKPTQKITKVEKAVFAPTPAKTTATAATTAKPKGSFVQIGAFSKPISKDYLSNIQTQGLSYYLYKIKIKDKMYTKVLIGPYRNKAHAQNDLPSIKQKLKINSAFILSF